jgi:hypothetical protein
MRTGAWFCVLLICCGLVAPFAQAAQPAPIPSRPVAPPALSHKAPPEVFSCQRFYVWKGRQLECDSQLARDGENLRPILSDVPAAEAELNSYQRTRRQVRILAYTSTFGLAMIVAGYFIAQSVGGTQGVTVRNVVMGGGAALSAGSIFFGLGLLKANEARLGKAVSIYNHARPDTPIELEFSTGFRF